MGESGHVRRRGTCCLAKITMNPAFKQVLREPGRNLTYASCRCMGIAITFHRDLYYVIHSSLYVSNCCPEKNEKCMGSLGIVKVNPLVFNRKRVVFDLSENRPHIFADDADKNQLHGRKEEHADHQRGQSECERFPV